MRRIIFSFYYCTATLHKLAAAHLQAPERQIGYCTPIKTVAYNKFNKYMVSECSRPLMLKPCEAVVRAANL